MFSISASSSDSASSRTRTSAGIVSSPASCAARQRRSPAISSNRPSSDGRTSTGWSTPRELHRRRRDRRACRRRSARRGWRGLGEIELDRDLAELLDAAVVVRRHGHDRREPAAHAALAAAAGAQRPRLRSRSARDAHADALPAEYPDALAAAARVRATLAGERDVGVAAGAVGVVQGHRHAEARRLAEADVARDHGVEDEPREVLADVALDVAAQARARVVHRQHHAGDRRPGLSSRWTSSIVSSTCARPSSAKYSVCTGTITAIGGDQRVDRQRPERRRAVDQHVAEAVAHRPRARRAAAARSPRIAGSSTVAPASSTPEGISESRSTGVSWIGRRGPGGRAQHVVAVGAKRPRLARARPSRCTAGRGRPAASACPAPAMHAATLTAVVVLPTPPFWLAIAIRRHRRHASGARGPYAACARRDAGGAAGADPGANARARSRRAAQRAPAATPGRRG